MHRIRAVVVMTDGDDTDPSHDLFTLIKRLHREDSGPAVFTIGYGDEPNQAALEALAKAGAGSFSKGNVDTIIPIFRDVGSFF